MGATLLRVADLAASGAKEGPEDEASCTSKLCGPDPKCAKSAPSVIDELHISSKPKTMRRTVYDFGKKTAKVSPPLYNAILELKYSLSMATQHLGQHAKLYMFWMGKGFRVTVVQRWWAILGFPTQYQMDLKLHLAMR